MPRGKKLLIKRETEKTPKYQCKQPKKKMNRYHSGKPVTTNNFFEGVEEELDHMSKGIRVEKIAKLLSIFLVKVNNFLSFS